MKKLKNLRQAHNYTQQQLAEMLQTTQQTIARWETGKADPSLSALRDLAMIFGTSVDDLLGTNPFSKRLVTNRLHLYEGRSEDDGFWGHLGVLVPGLTYTKWFPITLSTADQVSGSLKNIELHEHWFSVTTLNNRMLAINALQTRRIWLLDDACDAPDDWKDIQGEYSGHPLEFYRGLDLLFCDPDNFEKTSSPTYRRIIREFVQKNDFDDEKIAKFLRTSHIYMTDGNNVSYLADPEHLYNFIVSIDLGQTPKMVHINACDGEFESFFPAQTLVMVEMPLLDVIETAKEDLAQSDGRVSC